MIENAIEPEFSEFVERQVASGRFRSPAEVVSEGLRLLREREQLRDALIRDLQTGIDQLDAGEGVVVDSPAAQESFIAGIFERGARRRRTT
jgi:putative addiction module CopG family antidote